MPDHQILVPFKPKTQTDALHIHRQLARMVAKHYPELPFEKGRLADEESLIAMLFKKADVVRLFLIDGRQVVVINNKAALQ